MRATTFAGPSSGAASILAACVLLAGLGTGGAASAQQWGDASSGFAKLNRIFGRSGLMTEFSQDDFYGTIMNRQALSGGQYNTAQSTGVASGYQDELHQFSLPISGTFALPDGQSFIMVKADNDWIDGDRNLSYSDTNALNGRLAYIHMIGEGTLLSFSLLSSDIDVDLKSSAGHVDGTSYGVRADLLQMFNPRWGYAGRVIYSWNTNKTRIPIPGTGMELTTDQDNGELYTEQAVVGNFGHDQLAVVPQGWTLYPKFRMFYTNTSYETVTDSFGDVVRSPDGSKVNEYGSMGVYARLENNTWKPWHPAPYIELGVEREMLNDLDSYVDDPTIIYSRIGASMPIGTATRVELAYTRNDGTKGDRDTDTGLLTISMEF